MAEHRHHDRQAEEERDRADHQGGGDDEAPQRHGHRIFGDDPDRGGERHRGADIAVEQQRKRDGADREHHDGEQETDTGADDDQIEPARVAKMSWAKSRSEPGAP